MQLMDISVTVLIKLLRDSTVHSSTEPGKVCVQVFVDQVT